MVTNKQTIRERIEEMKKNLTEIELAEFNAIVEEMQARAKAAHCLNYNTATVH